MCHYLHSSGFRGVDLKVVAPTLCKVTSAGKAKFLSPFLGSPAIAKSICFDHVENASKLGGESRMQAHMKQRTGCTRDPSTDPEQNLTRTQSLRCEGSKSSRHSQRNQTPV